MKSKAFISDSDASSDDSDDKSKGKPTKDAPKSPSPNA